MATTAVATSQPIVNGDMNTNDAAPTSTVSTWNAQEVAPHPRAAEIIRQVENYFSDDNICQDAHLLGLMNESNDGSVSLSEILSFKKMRQFKAPSAVKEALKQSTLVEIVGKRIKRRYPPSKPVTVVPKVNSKRKVKVVPEDKPWLTKNMMKPTGFEANANDGPVKPEEYNKDRQDYDPEINFTSRIEVAITRFCARRTMHQETRGIWDRFMVFGGMACGSRAFTGGLDEKTMEDYTKKEIAELTSYYGVSEFVLDAVYESEDKPKEEVKWVVDFEGAAKAFLSSQFVSFFDWHDEKKVCTAKNVLRNFYNYLLLHDVCPEHKEQILAARKVCNLAEEELPKLSEVDTRLPGDFSMACSTLFGGYYSGLYAGGSDWAKPEEIMGWSDKDANTIFLTGLTACGTDEQLAKAEAVIAGKGKFKVVSEEKLSLEITSIDFPTDEANKIYSDPRLSDTLVKPMGKMHCKRWAVPHTPPTDLPKSVTSATKAQGETFAFLVEESTLKYCYPGLKMEAVVKEVDVGIKWIDYVEASYASFFTWLANERIREWKEPGPPKGWMKRQMGEEDTGGGDGEKAEGGDVEDDEAPD